uniref:F-box domain-containing protein n=1 Tax=Rhabditophanes sp. KR3021 TaxID=114890 RepID=A0AC35UGC2_9BILA
MLHTLPLELLQETISNLTFEDLIKLKATCQSFEYIVAERLSKCRRLQISDDAKECQLETSDVHLNNNIVFKIESLKRILLLCNNIDTVIIAAKGINRQTCESSEFSKIFNEGLFNEHGYLGAFFAFAPQSYLEGVKLKSIALHVDYMFEEGKISPMQYPQNDLIFSIINLAEKPFDTFIQIGYCASNHAAADFYQRSFYVGWMQETARQMAHCGISCVTDVALGNDYLDITVEKGLVEYSFAYFVYDPEICQIRKEGMEERDGYVVVNDDQLEEVMECGEEEQDEQILDEKLKFYCTLV